MEVLLIQPPHYFSGQTRAPDVFPLGLGYIARALLNAGHQVKVLDIWAHQYSNEVVSGKIGELSFDVAAVSAISTQYSYVKWLTRELKKHQNKPVILGGALSTLSPEVVISNTSADICVIGEGEITLPDILKNIDHLENVEGIYYKKKDNTIVKQPPRRYIENLDTIDFPAWDLFPIDVYLKHQHVEGRIYTSAMNVITGRGCPWNCRFCSKTFTGSRLRSVDNLIAEVKLLVSKYHLDGVHFADELTVVSKKRAFELCEAIKPLNIMWSCNGRVNIVDYDLLKAMKKAGCQTVMYGIESGSQQMLNRMYKQITVEQSRQAITNTIKAGLIPELENMFGYPGETEETIQETIDFYKSLPFVGFLGNFAATTPLPGSALYQDVLKEGLIKDEDKYLELISGGYNLNVIPAKLTAFSDAEFFEQKSRMEKTIFFNSLKKYPFHYIRYYLDRGFLTLTKKGFRYTLSKAVTVARAYLEVLRKK